MKSRSWYKTKWLLLMAWIIFLIVIIMCNIFGDDMVSKAIDHRIPVTFLNCAASGWLIGLGVLSVVFLFGWMTEAKPHN